MVFQPKIVLAIAVLVLCCFSFQTVNGRETFGCHKGYCWSYCSAFSAVEYSEWCYTTKTHSQSYQYVPCKSQDDCEHYWHCGGPCASI